MPAARTHRLRPRAPPGAGARRRPPQRDRGRRRTRRRGRTRSGRLGVSAERGTGEVALGPSPVSPGPRAARGLGDPRPAVSQTGGPACTAGGPRARGARPSLPRQAPPPSVPGPSAGTSCSVAPVLVAAALFPGCGSASDGGSERGPGPSLPAGTPPAADDGRRGRVGPLCFRIPRVQAPGPGPVSAHVRRWSERCRVTLTLKESFRRRFFPPAAQQVTQFTSRSLEEGPPLTMSSGPGSGWSPWPPIALPRAVLGGSSSRGPAQGSPRTCPPVSWSLCHCVAGCRARGSLRDVVAECLLGPEVAATRAHLLGTRGCP